MEILYHYCSAESFHAIISNRCLRFSSLSLSNDTSEGKLVSDAISRLAEQDKLGFGAKMTILESIDTLRSFIDGLGFCLSREGDLLSQWRGYAADGTGVSIGFSNQYLNWLGSKHLTEATSGFKLREVLYKLTEHEDQIRASYEEAKKHLTDSVLQHRAVSKLLSPIASQINTLVNQSEAEESKNAHRALHNTILQLFPSFYTFKSPAFQEELEWRLLAHSFTGDDEYSPLKYFPSKNRLVPYREFELLNEGLPAVVRVVLGPKHITPESVIKEFLRRSGFNDVEVVRSAASYR